MQGCWARGYDWGSRNYYSSPSGGQAHWNQWNWREGYQGQGWGDDWGRSTASSSAAAPPPEPAQLPRQPATTDDSAPPQVVASSTDAPATAAEEVPQQELRTALIQSEEYCELDGMPHFKRTFTDGTVEYEPW